MHYVLIAGAALNYLAALKLLAEVIARPLAGSDPEEYVFLKVFVAGVAVTFGSFYVYLFNHLAYVMPFLIFGAALKSWAFLVSIYMVARRRIGVKLFVELGVSNGVVAGLFWVYILQLA